MKPIVYEHDEHHLSYGKYVAGFLGSMILTVGAYLLATHAGNAEHKQLLTVALAGLAVIQFVVQMFLFLHVGEERGPRLRLLAATLMLGAVLILVFGSLWVMNNLNYRMTPQQITQYLKSQDNL